MFKHNICGDQPEVLNGMLDSSYPLPLEVFVNLRCPPVPVAIEATIAEVDQSEAAGRAKEPEKSAPVGDFDGISSLSFFFFLKFL